MRRITIHCLLLLAIGSLSTIALAEDDAPAEATRADAAVAMLEKVDAAIKAIDTVRYTASTKASGFATQFVQDSSGEVLMSGWNGSIPASFWQHVSTTTPEGETIELTGGGDGESFFVVDHASKKGYEDMDPGVFGSFGRALQALAMLEFVHNAPFDDELGAEVLEVVGEETIGGEPCMTIRVVYTGGRGESIWSFSTRDHLPRKRIRKFSDPSRGDGAIENTITKLQVAPKYDASLFRMALPDGYEQIDDFAP